MAMHATIATQDPPAGRGNNRQSDPTKPLNVYLTANHQDTPGAA
jgi:hypothetical protein